MISQILFVSVRYELPKGKSAGPALQYFYMIHRVGRSVWLVDTLAVVLDSDFNVPEHLGKWSPVALPSGKIRAIGKMLPPPGHSPIWMV